ncbi:MAG: extracellular solute-binding protein [Rhodomicrobium sp.]|nr:extracellular solute-binding protein [Rhodomicrobium sp.]
MRRRRPPHLPSQPNRRAKSRLRLNLRSRRRQTHRPPIPQSRQPKRRHPIKSPFRTGGPAPASAEAAATAPSGSPVSPLAGAEQPEKPAAQQAQSGGDAAPAEAKIEAQPDNAAVGQSNQATSPLPADTAPAAAAAPPPPPQIDPKDITLKIATWGGAYGESQQRAFFAPFTSRFGYRIETATYDGDYAALQKQGAAPEWSLVDLNGEAASRACKEGLLEPLDQGILERAPSGATVAEDFLPAAIHPCAIGSVAWSAVIVYDKRLKQKPQSLTDFFDVKKIPGKRSLPRQPRYTLELALMADGVKPEEVYAVLATMEGQDRAFAKLSTIKDDIVWWDKPSEVFGRISDKQAVMGLGFNGRAFMAIVAGREPLEILWDRQIYALDYWAIPRGAPHQDAARAFIRFATSPGPLADQTRWLPYGPARLSAVELAGKHSELDLEMKPFLPTYAPNLANALAFDGDWWAENEAALQARFADWVEGRQLPVQKETVTSQ